MKNNNRINRHNFVSTLATHTAIDPHAAYTCLAIDSALLHFNEQLPKLDDEEQQLICDSAQAAAQAVLAMAAVPNDWLDILVKLDRPAGLEVRSGLWEIVFDLLDEGPAAHERKTKLEETLLACAGASSKEAARNAINALSDVYMHEILESIYAAFQLGFEIATDPTRLIIEKTKS